MPISGIEGRNISPPSKQKRVSATRARQTATQSLKPHGRNVPVTIAGGPKEFGATVHTGRFYCGSLRGVGELADAGGADGNNADPVSLGGGGDLFPINDDCFVGLYCQHTGASGG